MEVKRCIKSRDAVHNLMVKIREGTRGSEEEDSSESKLE